MTRARNSGFQHGPVSHYVGVGLTTDRILFRGSQLRLKEYHRAELRTSDHRPVYAVFQATVREIDESRKEQITQQITQEIRKTGPRDATVDEKVQRGLNGGFGGLVKEMTRSKSVPNHALTI